MLSQTEARELVERCMRVLYYRDARSYNRVRKGLQGINSGVRRGAACLVPAQRWWDSAFEAILVYIVGCCPKN